MRTPFLNIAFGCLVVFTGFARASDNEVALITDKPQQKYIVLSPLSAEDRNLEKIYKKIKDRAKTLKANAVIEWKCTEHVKNKTVHSCSGFAVKWVN